MMSNDLSIDIDDLFFLFNDFVGGADIDDVYDEYGHLNLNNSKDRKDLIDNHLSYSFLEMSDEQKNRLEKSLALCVVSNDLEMIRAKADSFLFPFELPENLVGFFKEIYIALYPDN